MALASPAHLRAPVRTGGYAPIRDYAAIGNKRTAALVALDGSIDWLCLPTFDSPAVFAAVLDAERGGRFVLQPAVPFSARRRYLEDTNVLETTFETAGGCVTVIDGMTRPTAHGLVWNQIVRRVQGAGGVPMRWDIEPRFEYGSAAVRPERRGDVPVFHHGEHTLAVEAHGVGAPAVAGTSVRGAFVTREGGDAVLALSAFHDEPITLSTPGHLVSRLEATCDRWRRWLRDCDYSGPWKEAVRRSALALDLLVEDQSGAIAAAVTMALPERIGGDRNYDYRYGWLRDVNLTLGAMQRLGFRDQVHMSMAWMFRTLRADGPELRPMYRLEGDPQVPLQELPLPSYRGSRPVTLGNAARDQLQLGNYGDLFDMTAAFVRDGGGLQPHAARWLADAADRLCGIWRQPDAGIWELDEERPYTQGKLASWLALTHAAELAEAGELDGGRAARWRREAAEVERFVQEWCWSERQRCYVGAAGSEELDAAVLLATRGAFMDNRRERLTATVDAIRRELGAGGPLVYRYSGASREEGAFVACSFWVVEALACAGRRDEAAEAMDSLVALANDVGLYSEEIDPATGEFLGNLPQALSHLALVDAAVAISG